MARRKNARLCEEREIIRDFFDTEYLKADLKERSVRGGAVTIVAQAASFFLHMGSTVVLARLLTPQDFGLIAMVAAVTNFAMMFKDIGLSMATVQKPDINHTQVSTLFWINVATGMVIAACLVALAPAVASFYGNARLTPVTMALAGTFVFGGLTVQHQALLSRHMRFFSLSLISIIAMAIGVAAAIVAGILGAGYWSLVIMYLVIAAGTALGTWIAVPWRPCLPRNRTGVREMLGFGGNVTAFNFVNYFARNMDNILIGKFCGAGALGLYSKAYGLLMLPISQIRRPLTSVAVPALSRIQDDPKRYTSYYSKLVLVLSFVSMPLTVFLAVCSRSIIHLLLGDQWLEASGIFQILAITAFIQPTWSTVGLVLLSLGQSRRYLRFGLINSLGVVTSFAVGIRWGAMGVAAAYAVANYLILFPSLWYCYRGTPISIRTFLRAIIRPVIASVVTVSVIVVARRLLVSQHDITVVSVCLGIGISAYLLVWSLMPGGFQLLREFARYVPLIFAKKPRDSEIG
ncbi:MAG: hypothetical protein AMJ43_07455 [Coxiella sp. DG_40]|nr:MAG: hypothetical protein AMJ43_07455 [Coxiella sp. DG_40]